MGQSTVLGSMLIHRKDLLNTLHALYLSHIGMRRQMKDDPYACGYHEGFEVALLSFAQITGLFDEFEAQTHCLQTKNIVGAEIPTHTNLPKANG